MNDITKCSNKECAINDRCWRYQSPLGEHQAMVRYIPYHLTGTNIVKCDNFLPLRRNIEE
jgi:hypothetical protein